MALNIFGALGALGRLLPGYVQGHRQAVQDNWNDLNQYNAVQHGQVANAFDEAMFNPRLAMGQDAAAQSRMGVYQSGMNLNTLRAAYPGAMAQAVIGSMYAPQLALSALMGQLGQQQGLQNYYWNPQSQGYWGQTGMNPFGWLQSQQGAQMYGGWPWMPQSMTPQGNPILNLPSTQQ